MPDKDQFLEAFSAVVRTWDRQSGQLLMEITALKLALKEKGLLTNDDLERQRAYLVEELKAEIGEEKTAEFLKE